MVPTEAILWYINITLTGLAIFSERSPNPMSAIGLPFNPLREGLYSRTELFEGLSKNDPKSYAKCADIAILSYFAKYGRSSAGNVRSAAAMEALHDSSISMATNEFLRAQKKVVAVMGGHG